MEDQVTKIIRMREGGTTQRCHCFPHHGSYDVAQHSFHMLILLEELHPDPPKKLYSAILRHDLFERWTGDTPSIIKRIVPELRSTIIKAEKYVEQKTGIHQPGTDKEGWLKALDEIEFLMWTDDQIAMGNKIAELKREEVITSLKRIQLPEPCQQFLRSYQWERTRDDLE